jgi:hypothetical protein
MSEPSKEAMTATNRLCQFFWRWWPALAYGLLCVGWIAWCMHDGLAGMFAPAIAGAGIPVVLMCAYEK